VKGEVKLLGFTEGKRRVLAAVSGRVVANMERACVFAAGEARNRAPVSQRAGVRHMREDITHQVTARGLIVEGVVGVRARSYWAWFVERGTSKMAAHPFLRPAVFGNAQRILAILRGEA